MADVTGGSLARRPAFFLSASLGVALVIATFAIQLSRGKRQLARSAPGE